MLTVDVGSEGCREVEIYDWLPWQDKKNFLQIYHEFPDTRRFADEYEWYILAIPEQGYRFDHWEFSSIGLFNLESVLPEWTGDLTANPTILDIPFFYQVDQEILIVPYFEPIDECDCTGIPGEPVDCTSVPCTIDPGDIDNDGDLISVNEGDCDDNDPEIHPYAKDTATKNMNCDGFIEVEGPQCPPCDPEYIYETEYVEVEGDCPDVDCDDGSCFINAISK